MANIVPQSDLLGQLGRLEKRWSEVHGALARMQAVELVAVDPAVFPNGAPNNALTVTADGKLKFGNGVVATIDDLGAVGGDLAALVNQVNTFLNGAAAGDLDTLAELQGYMTALEARVGAVEANIAEMLIEDGTLGNQIALVEQSVLAEANRAQTEETRIEALAVAAGGARSLSNLSDVADDLSDIISDGQVLTYSQFGGGKWVARTPTAGVTTLNGLDDATVSNPVEGQLLVYASGQWRNGATKIAYMADVNITNPQEGQVITNIGGVWQNATPAQAALGDLTNVQAANPAEGDVLQFTPGGWVNAPLSFAVSDLTDVNLTGPVRDQVLTYNGSGAWVNVTPITTLRGLDDVNLENSITDRHVLTWDGGTKRWVNAAAQGGGGAVNLADLADVSNDPPADGQVLAWNRTAGLWVAAPASQGNAVTALSQLTDDVRATGMYAPGNGAFLRWNSDESVWQPSSADELYPKGLLRGTVQAGGAGNTEFEPTGLLSTFEYTQVASTITVNASRMEPLYPEGTNDVTDPATGDVVGTLVMPAMDLGTADNPFGTVYANTVRVGANSVYIGTLKLGEEGGELVLTGADNQPVAIATEATVNAAISDAGGVTTATVNGLIQTAINTEITARNTAITNAVNEEVTARNAAITINSQATLSSAEIYTNSAVAQEATAREGAIQNASNTLNTAIDAAETRVAAQVSAEVADREAAVAFVESSLATETVARESGDATLTTRIDATDATLSSLSSSVDSISDTVNGLYIVDAAGEQGQLQIAGSLAGDGETRGFSAFPVSGVIEFSGSTLTRAGLQPSASEISGFIDLGASDKRFKSAFLSDVVFSGGTLTGSSTGLVYKGTALPTQATLDSQLSSVRSEITAGDAAQSSLISGVQLNVVLLQGSLSTLQERVSNIAQNTDPAALDSLTEIVSAFQNADSDLNSAISALATGTSNRVTALTGISANTYTAPSDKSQLAGATSLYDADNKLADAIQAIVDSTQSSLLFGEGLSLSGSTLSTSFSIADYATSASVTAEIAASSSLLSAEIATKQDALSFGAGLSLSGSTLSTSFSIADYATAASLTSAVAVASSLLSAEIATKQDTLSVTGDLSLSGSTLSTSFNIADYATSASLTSAVAAASSLLSAEIATKQGALSFGSGLSLSGSTLSTSFDIANYATGASLTSAVAAASSLLSAEIATKQSALTAGSSIDISGSTISVSSGLLNSVNANTAKVGFTDTLARGALSAASSSSDGSALSYNNVAGVFTYSGAIAGTNITISGGSISLSDIVSGLVVAGHILESFDHGTITVSYDSATDFGSVSSSIAFQSVDLGGLSTGSIF